MRLNLFLSGSRKPINRLRRLLRRLGPSWSFSPARRLVQALALAAFLVALFVVQTRAPVGVEMTSRTVLYRLPRVALELDPLMSASAAVAGLVWVAALMTAGTILLVCLIFPRGFCAWLCPLGTIIDLVDRALARPARRLRIRRRGWWVHLRYYVLLALLVTAAGGVLASGFLAAIPLVTRGLVALVSPFQTGLGRGWSMVPPITAGQVASVVLFLAVLALGLMGPRFWCRCVCPTGAVFSLASRLRLMGRRVDQDACIRCGKCVTACAFDAIKPDFTTRPAACTFCQSCGGACPVGAISFTHRWHAARASCVPRPACLCVSARRQVLSGRAKTTADDPGGFAPVSRRGFLAGTAAGATALIAAPLGQGRGFRPVRPPGSVPEDLFLRLCVRCGNCISACPTNTLRPLGVQQGLVGLWTPHAVGDWAGCDPACNRCGAACPTGAIRRLPLDEKRVARMGLAVVNEKTCLPHAGAGECQLCHDACALAGYHAIEFRRVGVELNEAGMPLEETGFVAPAVIRDRCVGCGLCQARCSQVNVAGRGVLADSAIRVRAGRGREDRLRRGSYRALRAAEERRREAERRRLLEQQQAPHSGNGYLPDFLD